MRSVTAVGSVATPALFVNAAVPLTLEWFPHAKRSPISNGP
jgi:hypothetical protein